MGKIYDMADIVSPAWVFRTDVTCLKHYSYQEMCSRPAQFFLENWDKLHGRRLAKLWLDTNFQPPQTLFDHASEALKVPKAVRIFPTWGPLELRRRGQTMSEEAENW